MVITFFTIMEKNTLYVRALKALYGKLISSLLWYHNFRRDLEEYGFECNQKIDIIDTNIHNFKIKSLRQSYKTGKNISKISRNP